ncbi:hypothetical protein NEUTE1DRAFT_55094 [Neurospora tetrasperma FGSC 2508]|uniref:Uncharacterized protein n=1 Tax=Neurospora tetrasperma (strain FGSC 2508 / ATCC MYA-4615 / P0657) TaxID=510951 RepID=F8N475_NEUT8|nr:uncharacterized protein NEUTE1DRAFT_55094 [Neurospora tetrasperma FGSC 2508]EGO53518.1 hypothetical protein NEUTE1DRAFT_55094 [Neurospora tetrasperma FGSC 2508]
MDTAAVRRTVNGPVQLNQERTSFPRESELRESFTLDMCQRPDCDGSRRYGLFSARLQTGSVPDI